MSIIKVGASESATALPKAMLCVYVIRHIPSGICYVGSTKRPSARWQSHLFCLRHSKHHSSRLQNSWNHHGEGYFEFEIIEELDYLTMRDWCEQEHLDAYLKEFGEVFNAHLSVRAYTDGKRPGPRDEASRLRSSVAVQKAWQEPGRREAWTAGLKKASLPRQMAICGVDPNTGVVMVRFDSMRDAGRAGFNRWPIKKSLNDTLQRRISGGLHLL